jgi:ribonuclease P protein component
VAEASPPSFSFPRSSRLRRRGEFLAVRGGQSYVEGPLAVTWRPRKKEGGAAGMSGTLARVGITVSSKVGGAVVRNRVKRRLREAIRHELAGLPAVDLVVVARPSAVRSQVAHFRAFLRVARDRMAGGAG